MTTAFKELDVRNLLSEGIEPFPHIRKMIDSLQPDEGLAVIAPFLPSPLIEKLKGEGFRCRPERQSDGSWVAQFWRE